jgi:hypothetical protein
VQNSAGLFICTNKHNAPGRLFVLKEDCTCRNHRQHPVSKRPRICQPTNGDTRFIPLTQGRFAIVDASDFDWLNSFKWHVSIKGNLSYAICHFKGRSESMHRLIMNPPAGMFVDHIDRNGLNNKRSNLRVCTRRQNSYNRIGHGCTSKYKGVYWEKNFDKWRTAIRYNKKTINLGSFNDEIAAAKAYDQMAAKLFKEFAYLNFPDQTNNNH